MLKLFNLTILQNLVRTLLEYIGRTNRTFQFYLNLLTLFAPKTKTRNDSRPKSLVVIASDFLPCIHGGVYRPLSWLEYASSHGVPMRVLTNHSTRIDQIGLSLLADKTISTHIYYCVENEFQLFSSPTRLWLARPEFLMAALDSLEKINRVQPISHIVATGPDFTSFVIAAMFAKKHNCQIHLDYRDEWTESPFEFSQATFCAKLLERKCVQHAQSISLTTLSQLINFKRKWNREHKVFLNQNGCDNFPYLSKSIHNNPRKIRLCHSGKIGGHNSLVDILSLLKNLLPCFHTADLPIELKLCGVITETERQLLHDQGAVKSIILGQLTPEQAFIECTNADLNILLIDERFERYLPGKLFGYIASGNPILVIGASHSLEIAELCTEYEVSHYFADVRNYDLDRCAHFVSNAPLLKTPTEQLIRFRHNFDRKAQAKSFISLFDDPSNV